MRRSMPASRVAIRRAKMQQNATECNGMQHILGLHQPYYERSAPSLFEWLLDASAALADRRRHGRARADGREDLGAAGLFRYGGMDTADVGRLADLPRSGVSP